jgi:hypothetical protein
MCAHPTDEKQRRGFFKNIYPQTVVGCFLGKME